jgi:kanamycin kinase
MRRTLTEKVPFSLPREILALIEGAKIYDSSSSPQARVYYLEKDSGYYLKISPKNSLSCEAKMTDYFYKKGLGAKVVEYISDDWDYFLTSKVRGEDATHEKFLSEPKRLCDLMATRLRSLHETDFSDCPIQNRNESYLALAKNNYEKGVFDLSLTEELFKFKSTEDAYSTLCEGKNELKSDALLHGDYCLPNIILTDNFDFSAFIDLGNGGVGDRHIDIFWGVWTLFFNLKTNEYKDRFIDAYGRDVMDENMLKIIAAAEVFG